MIDWKAPTTRFCFWRRELLAEDGEEIPSALSISEHRHNLDSDGAIWEFVEVDITPFLGQAEKINYTLGVSSAPG